jgi:anaerobic selenocysteine-containing dehydrogenase
LQAAAPDVWVEMSFKDAADHDISEGDVVNVSTPRGTIRAQVRISGIRDEVLFVLFHYGYWIFPTVKVPITTAPPTSSPSPPGIQRPSRRSSRRLPRASTG